MVAPEELTDCLFSMKASVIRTIAHPPGNLRLIESLRIVLAIIAGLLLLDMQPATPLMLSAAVFAFGIYAVILLLFVAKDAFTRQRRIFYWLDACWFLLLMSISAELRTFFFLLLFFPVFFVASRIGYRECIELAAFSAIAATAIFFLSDPDISWIRLMVLPMSLVIVGPLFMFLAWVEAGTQKSRAFSAQVIEGINSRRAYDSIIPEVMGQMAAQLDAAVAIMAMRTLDGRCRVFCWEDEEGSSELTEKAALSVGGQILSLTDETSFGWHRARHWWQREQLTAIGPSGSTFNPSLPDREKLAALSDIVGQLPLMTVSVSSPRLGHLRLVMAGDLISVNRPALENMMHIVEQVSPSVENAYLREALVIQAADTERARIGRDLHDSALQPYIGLKFALEAVQRRAGPDNPVAPDLAQLGKMVTSELAQMREVISGLRGSPGTGGALLSSAVQRQAKRFGQLFGIQVDVEVEGEILVNRRIAGELFHIIAEGLSNIRRHTHSNRAWISLCSADGELVLDIRNKNFPHGSDNLDFTPSSLSERAAELGGTLQVGSNDSFTTVTVRVPTLRKDSRE